jgi:hypothetical protein
MNRDKSDSITASLEALSVFRGIYKRVAVLLDIDPSYVSRVARGERNAPFVSDALRKEIQRVLGKAGLHNGHDGDGKNHDHSNGSMPAMLDGHSTDRRLRDGQGRTGHAKNARPLAVNGNHTPVDGRQGGRKQGKAKAKKSASAARRHEAWPRSAA